MKRILLGLLVIVAGAASAPAQTCTPHWTPGLFESAGFNGPVNCFTQYDPDGPGPLAPVMVVGGGFTVAGGVAANFIAAGDGVHWAPLGSGLSQAVTSLAVFDEDGPGPGLPRLFAGGGFLTAGGLPAAGIARWDGTSWTQVGGGSLAPITWQSRVVMCVVDEDGPGPLPTALFVGASGPTSTGSFALTSAGGVPVASLARWNGTAWSAVPGLTPGHQVTAVEGFFYQGFTPGFPKVTVAVWLPPGNQTSIMYWSGGTWTAYGSPVNGWVSDLKSQDPDGTGPAPNSLFYAGDGFGVWSGAYWQAIPFPLSFIGPSCTGFYLSDLSAFDDDGPGPHPTRLALAGKGWGVPTGGGFAAFWDGTWFQAIAAPPATVAGVFDDVVRTLGVFDPGGGAPPRLFAGGSFTAAGISCPGFAAWEATGWSIPGNGLDAFAGALVEYDPDGPGPAPSILVAGGAFVISTPTGVASLVAAWNGTTWAPLGSGLGGVLTCLATHDEDGPGPQPPVLYAGGRFTNFGSICALARWDGTAWAAVPGTSTAETCNAMQSFDEDGPGPAPEALYTASEAAGGYSFVRRWVNQAPTGGWSASGSGFSYNACKTLCVFDADGPGPGLPVLCAGGAFASMNGVAAPKIAAWNGQTWSAVGVQPFGVPPFGEQVDWLAEFDDDGPGGNPPRLYALTAGQLASWNGVSWQMIPMNPVQGGGATMAVHDPDGPGGSLPLLYVGGTFSGIGGIAANSIAAFDGTNWSALGTGLTNQNVARALVSVHEPWSPFPARPALYAGGLFTIAGGSNSSCLARWATDPNLSLGYTDPGTGVLLVQNTSCLPGQSYLSTFSVDPLNAAAPGLGWWAGLHISLNDVLAQYGFQVAPFVGVLDAAGASTYVLPASLVTALSGVTVWGVTRTYDPVLYLPLAASGVASWQF